MNNMNKPTMEVEISAEELDRQIELRKQVLNKKELDRLAKGDFTKGEKLVGMDFNPSGDPYVAKTKRYCADLIDLLIDRMDHDSSAGPLKTFVYQQGMALVLQAQMMIVKLITFKY